MAQIETLLVHADRWPASNCRPDKMMAVWTAHRPLVGDVTWTGSNVGYGMHFAASVRDHERFGYFVESNRRDDAREVVLVTNLQSVELASERCLEKGRGAYGLAAYLNAYPGREGAQMFVETYDLPWSETDLTADALIARLSGGAA